jgi:hypothetical protein
VSLIALHYQETRDLIIIDAASFEDFAQKRADNFISVFHAENPPLVPLARQLSGKADVIVDARFAFQRNSQKLFWGLDVEKSLTGIGGYALQDRGADKD